VSEAKFNDWSKLFDSHPRSLRDVATANNIRKEPQTDCHP
jgi:hypothetical protein